MAHFSVGEANAWLESTKLSLDSIDPNLESQIAEQVLARLRAAFDAASTWSNEATTPGLVRSIIAMLYAASIYERSYGDNHDDTNNYAGLLRSMAESNIIGLTSGVLEISEDLANQDDSQPSFFPNNISSLNPATSDNPNDGGPYFTMGMVF